jgi:hypothetical protein
MCYLLICLVSRCSNFSPAGSQGLQNSGILRFVWVFQLLDLHQLARLSPEPVLLATFYETTFGECFYDLIIFFAM